MHARTHLKEVKTQRMDFTTGANSLSAEREKLHLQNVLFKNAFDCLNNRKFYLFLLIGSNRNTFRIAFSTLLC